MRSHDPGGIRTSLPGDVKAQAIYGGPDDCYRYRLDWVWNLTLPTLLAGMMNPSCAGHLNGDRTVAWVHRWCVRNGYGRLIVVNSCAYRAMDQARLAEVDDAAGPDNAHHILEAAREADTIVLGYGKPKVRSARDHGPRMRDILIRTGRPIHVWGLTGDGTPRHPLYLPGDSQITLLHGDEHALAA